MSLTSSLIVLIKETIAVRNQHFIESINSTKTNHSLNEKKKCNEKAINGLINLCLNRLSII